MGEEEEEKDVLVAMETEAATKQIARADVELTGRGISSAWKVSMYLSPKKMFMD